VLQVDILYSWSFIRQCCNYIFCIPSVSSVSVTIRHSVFLQFHSSLFTFFCLCFFVFFVYTFQHLICVCYFTIWNNKQIFTMAFFKLYFPCSQRLILYFFPICRLWAYTMNVIAETRRVHFTRYTFLFQFHLSTQALYFFQNRYLQIWIASLKQTNKFLVIFTVKGNHGLILGHDLITARINILSLVIMISLNTSKLSQH
jgi:hypothetical protein